MESSFANTISFHDELWQVNYRSRCIITVELGALFTAKTSKLAVIARFLHRKQEPLGSVAILI